MHLKNNELLIKTFHHHPLPFIIQLVKISCISFPFFLVASFFQGTLENGQMILIYSTIALLFMGIIVHEGVLYFIDRIVVTNQRILHINWKSIFVREENEAELEDIQDMKTIEMGVLSKLRIFDYGTFEVQTAGAKIAILFHNANDPEGIKNFVYHLEQKPSKIRALSHVEAHNDSTLQKKDADTSKISIGSNK